MPIRVALRPILKDETFFALDLGEIHVHLDDDNAVVAVDFPLTIASIGAFYDPAIDGNPVEYNKLQFVPRQPERRGATSAPDPESSSGAR